MRSPKSTGGHVNFKFNEIVVCPWWNLKIWGWEGKILFVTRENTERRQWQFHILILGPMNPGYGRNSIKYYTLNLEYILHPGGCRLSSAKYFYVPGTTAGYLERHSPIILSQLLGMMENMKRPGNSMAMGPLLWVRCCTSLLCNSFLGWT